MSSGGSEDPEKDTPADSQESPDESRDDTGFEFINVWRRWQGEADVPFHQYCDFFFWRYFDFFPLRQYFDFFCRLQDQEDSEKEEYEWIRYTRGRVREALQFTPGIIFVVVLLIGGAELLVELPGLIQPLNGTPLELALGIAGVIISVIWLYLLLGLLSKAELLPRSDSLQALLVYTTLLVLLVDVTHVFTRVTIALREGNIDKLEDVSFIPGSSLLLTLFVGGLLVYDGMLRTENMFSRLHKKEPPIIGPPDPDSFENKDDRDAAFERACENYKSNFLDEFGELLNHKAADWNVSRLPKKISWIPTAYVFAVVFVFPFLVLRLFDAADVAEYLSSISLSILNLVEIVVFFQFLVLIKYFNRLLTEHSPYEDNRNDGFTLQYQPDHPDGYAGFRDLGRFATRVNTLLFLGGLFTAYWLYTGGLRDFPTSAPSILSIEFVTWTFGYLGPLLVYVITVIVWIYFSFWQIHKTMRKGRERQIKKKIPDTQTGELPDQERDLKQAPTWPLNIRTFASIVIGDTLPLLSLVPLVL